MKKLILLLFACNAFIAYSQEKVLDLPELSKTNADIDTLICDSKCVLQLENDTIYIINKQGVDGYYEAIELYETLHENCEEYQKAETIIEAISTEFDSLNVSLHALEAKYELSLMENIKSNTQLRQQNAMISENLEIALRDLGNAKNKIKQERWNSMGMKILWGAGGIIIGTLVGGTLISISNVIIR